MAGPAVNYYLGLARGDEQKGVGAVVAGTASNGSSSDIELRMQINNGSNTTGLTKKDVMRAICILEQYIIGNGVAGGAGAGVDLPAL